MIDPEKSGKLPGLIVALVRVTFAERMLTSEGGMSVITSTTEDGPWFCGDEVNMFAPVAQPSSVTQTASAQIAHIH